MWYKGDTFIVALSPYSSLIDLLKLLKIIINFERKKNRNQIVEMNGPPVLCSM